MGRKTTKFVVLLVLAALATGTLYQLSAPSGAAPAARADKPVPVEVAQATTRDVPIRLQAVGRIEATVSVTLKARVDGQIINVLFTEGQHVRQGDVLIRLDPADFAARVRQAQANLARDQAQHVKARIDVDRNVALKDRGFVSAQKADEASVTADALAAGVRADEAVLDLARLQLDYTVIRAPFAGVIGAALAHPGALVKTNDTPLAVLNRVRPIDVSFAIPEKYALDIRNAMHDGPLRAMVQLAGSHKESVEGAVSFLDNAVNPIAGTVQLKARLENARETAMPGQFANVALLLGSIRGAVTLPAEAIQQGPDGALVFVVKDDRTVEIRRVEVASTQGRVAVVSKGIRTGETVVTDGHVRLYPGAHVNSRPRA